MLHSFALLALLAAQQVFVVASAPGPGVFSTTIQPAVDAASDGDVVLLKDGFYPGFQIAGKALTIVAHPDASSVRVNGTVLVAGVTQSPGVVLRRFDIRGVDGAAAAPALTIAGNAGLVRCENMQIQPGAALSIGPAADAVRITASASVVLRAVTMQGGSSPLIPALDGGAGLSIQDSAVYLPGSNCFGGDGNAAFAGTIAAVGGAGVSLQSGSLYTFGSWFRGGKGGGLFSGSASGPGGAGGPGLFCNGPTVSLSTEMYGGDGAPGPSGIKGATGPRIALGPSGSISFLPPPQRYFEVIPAAHAGSTGYLTFVGVPGEQAAFLLAPKPQLAQYVPVLLGALIVPLASATITIAGTVPPSGVLQVPLPIGSLPPGLASAQFEFQAVFFDNALSYVVLGPGSTLVILDPSF